MAVTFVASLCSARLHKCDCENEPVMLADFELLQWRVGQWRNYSPWQNRLFMAKRLIKNLNQLNVRILLS